MLCARSMARNGWTWIVCCVLWSVGAPDARAYEDELGLYGALGYTVTGLRSESPPTGPALELGLDWGAGAMWTVRGFGAYGWQPFSAGPARHLGWLGADWLYLLDVVQWVPYAGPGVFAQCQYQAGQLEVRPGLHVVVGVDYLADRTWTWGMQVRTQLHPGFTGEQDLELAVTAALALRWVLQD